MTDYLVDKSALARWGNPAVAQVLDELSDRGLLATCAAIEWEMVYSARNKPDMARIRFLLRGFNYLYCGDELFDRVLDVQSEALDRGFHRALSLADLIIAATAERHRAVVLHYDGDFDMIASITGQPTRWVAEPGTADR
ncbi:PIN domain nuclease [Microbispora sp. NPDC049633]|uniref:PIN domain nuclease n=1 Tax=Microbispora sp. NPDC049633 TaxID=3154355 RepID=UPI00341EEC5C